jgi:hypothetical protein
LAHWLSYLQTPTFSAQQVLALLVPVLVLVPVPVLVLVRVLVRVVVVLGTQTSLLSRGLAMDLEDRLLEAAWRFLVAATAAKRLKMLPKQPRRRPS